MGLFDKKYCSICGNEIKFLGNRKLDDGNMCKDCAAKLSPWFTGRRHTSVEAIKRQLEYRKANEAKLSTFNPNKVIGKRWKFYIDEAGQQFVVSSSTEWRRSNPDLIKFSDVTSLEIAIKEEVEELKTKDESGKSVSYDPPKYEYEYSFPVTILVRNGFFDDITFELTSDKPDCPFGELYDEYLNMAKEITLAITGKEYVEYRGSFRYPHEEGNAEEKPENKEEVKEEEKKEWFCPNCGTKNEGNFCFKCGTAKPISLSVNFCPGCGEKITDPSIKFCPKCGHQLTK